MGTSWSPDSKWLAYTLGTPTFFRRVHVYSLDQDKSFPVTDGLSDAGEPVFDPEGKYLYFLASTDAGPVRQWFDMSNADMRETSSLYLAVLRRDLPNPLAKESDEEKPKEEKKEEREARGRRGEGRRQGAGERSGQAGRRPSVSTSTAWTTGSSRCPFRPESTTTSRPEKAGSFSTARWIRRRRRPRPDGETRRSASMTSPPARTRRSGRPATGSP